jgi:Putative peptidoglycan binding domain
VLAGIGFVAAQSWFQDQTLLAGGDNFPVEFVRPDDVLNAARSVWGYSVTPTGGLDYSASLQALPALIAKGLSFGGLGAYASQRIVTTLLFAAIAPSMYLLLRTLMPPRRDVTPFVVGSFFYAFNAALFNFITTPVPSPATLMWITLLPLLPALILRGARSAGWLYPTLISLTTVATSYVFVNPPQFVLLAAACVLAVGVATYRSPSPTLRLLARTVPIVILVNLWWVLPVALVYLRGVSVTPNANPLEWSWVASNSSIPNDLRLIPSWDWTAQYIPYAPKLDSWPLRVLEYVPAAATFAAPFLTRGRTRRLATGAALVAVALTLLTKGLHAPLSGLNRALYLHVPGMWLFRDPTKFLAPLTIVFAIGVTCFLIGLPSRLRRFGAGAVAGAAALVSFPIWTGAVIPDVRPPLPPTHVIIPGYWAQAAGYINARPAPTLLLPADDFYQMPYTWGYYGTDNVADSLIDPPVVKLIDPRNDYLQPDREAETELTALRSAVRERSWRAAAARMRALGIRWILLRRDVNPGFRGRAMDLDDPGKIERALAHEPAFRLAGTFGRLDLFELRGARPTIWVTKRVVVTQRHEDVTPYVPAGSANVVLVRGGEATLDNFRVPRMVIPAGDWKPLRTGFTERLSAPAGKYDVFGRFIHGATAQVNIIRSGPDVLKTGVRGPSVLVLKDVLVHAGYLSTANGALTSEFDAQTQAALRRFQLAQGLPPDGVFGEATQARLLATGDRAEPLLTSRVVDISPATVRLDGRSLAPAFAPVSFPWAASDSAGALEIGRRIVEVPSRARRRVVTDVLVPPGANAVRWHPGSSRLPVRDGSFEQGTWGKVGDCNRSDSRTPAQVGLRVQRVPGGTDGHYALALSARAHTACVQQWVGHIDDRRLYRISIDSKRLRGASPRICVWQVPIGRCLPLPPLPSGRRWKRFTQLFRPERGTTALQIFVYADGGPHGTTSLYDHVQVDRFAPAQRQAIRVSQAWTKLGTAHVYRPTTTAQMRIPRRPLMTVLSSPSFEQGTWGAVGDCNRSDSRTPAQVGLRVQRVPGGTDGRFALALSARAHTACVQQWVGHIDDRRLYRISIDSKRLRGASPRICVWQVPIGRCLPLPPLPSGRRWKRFTQLFRPERGTTALQIVLYADGHREGTTILYDRVRLAEAAALPQIALVPRAGMAPRRMASAPKARVRQTSATSFDVSVTKVRGPFALVLDQTFDPAWHLSGAGVAHHFRANGYANGWIVDSVHKGGMLKIRFDPERWVGAARAVSLVAGAAILAILGGAAAAVYGRRRPRAPSPASE